MDGEDFEFQWQLEESDQQGNTFTTAYPPGRVSGYVDDPAYLWSYIIGSTPAVTIPQGAGGMQIRKKDVTIAPSDILDIDVSSTEIIVSNDTFGKSISLANYYVSRVSEVVFVLDCSPRLQEILGNVFEFRVRPLGPTIISRADTRMDLLPIRQNVCLKGLENGLVQNRLTPLLLSRPMGQTSIESNKLLYKRLHPQYYVGAFGSWNELEFYFEDEEGNKMEHNEGLMYIVLSLQWTVSGRTRFAEPLMKDCLWRGEITNLR